MVTPGHEEAPANEKQLSPAKNRPRRASWSKTKPTCLREHGYTVTVTLQDVNAAIEDPTSSDAQRHVTIAMDCFSEGVVVSSPEGVVTMAPVSNTI